MFTDEKAELKFYRQIFNKINAAIYTIDIDSYTIEWINESQILDSVLGLSRDEVLEQGEYIAAKLVSKSDFNESLSLAFDIFKEAPDVSWAGVFRIRHADGHNNWVIYSNATLETDENGIPTKTVVVAIDPQNILNTPKTLDDFVKYIRQLRYREVRDKLTGRQKEILELILKNQSEESISEELGISKYTVVDHRKSLYKKLEVNNSKELFAKAQKIGLM